MRSSNECYTVICRKMGQYGRSTYSALHVCSDKGDTLTAVMGRCSERDTGNEKSRSCIKRDTFTALTRRCSERVTCNVIRFCSEGDTFIAVM
jgi:hypothetical protein